MLHIWYAERDKIERKKKMEIGVTLIDTKSEEYDTHIVALITEK
jgi:hypothetical protein